MYFTFPLVVGFAVLVPVHRYPAHKKKHAPRALRYLCLGPCGGRGVGVFL